MIVRKILTKDFYPTLVEWSTSHKFPVLDIELLPEHIWVCYQKQMNNHYSKINNSTTVKGIGGEFYSIKPIYSIFVYPSEKIAWLAYPMSNPAIPYRDRKGGLRFLFKELEYELKHSKGIKMIFTTSSTERVEKALRDTGYQKGDESVTHYFKKIWDHHQQLSREPEKKQVSWGQD